MALLVAVAAAGSFGCSGLHAGPRNLALAGAIAVVGGSAIWAGGEAQDTSGRSGTSRGLTTAGFISVVAGLATLVAAGGWMAISVACEADPDCPDEEQCREVPAPPGGIPYRQCVPR